MTKQELNRDIKRLNARVKKLRANANERLKNEESISDYYEAIEKEIKP